MIIKMSPRKNSSLGRPCLYRSITSSVGLTCTVALFSTGAVQANNQYVRPTIEITQSYSDNVNLLPKGHEQSAFVTEINPGISFHKETAKLQASVDFRMQNILYAGSNNRNQTTFQGQANSTIELVDKSLFIDLDATHSQQNQSNRGRIARDNIAQNTNRTDVTTYSVSPYWTPHLGGVLEGEVRVKYAEVHTNGQLGDSRLHEERVHLVSGHDFNRTRWRFDFSNQQQTLNSDFQQNPRFQNVEGEIRQHLSKRHSLFVQVGNNNSRFTGSRGTNRNGFYAALGGSWRLNRKLAVEAALGNNSYASVDITPTQRTHWTTTFHHEDVGNNVGNRWETLFSHKSRRTFWQGSYSEDTITPQNVLLEQDVFAQTDPLGAPINNPVAGQPLQLAGSLPSLRNEVFIRKRGELSFSGETAKNTFNFQVYHEKRDFLSSGNDEDVFGIDGVWFWQFTRQAQSTIRAGWQEIKFDSQDDSNEQLWLISMRINQRMADYFDVANYIDGFLEYRFSSQDSERKEDEYIENRISAGVNINF